MTVWSDIDRGWSSARARLRTAWRWGADTSPGADETRAAKAARAAQLRGDPAFQTVHWGLIVCGGIVAALLIALATLDWNTMRGPAARWASLRTGRTVHIDGDLHVHIWSLTPRVEVNGLRVSNTDWAGGGDMIDIGHLVFDVRLLPLFGGHAKVPLIDVENASFRLVRDPQGRENWNFGNDRDNAPLRLPPVKHFIVRNAQLSITDERRKLVFTGTINSNESAKGQGRGFWMTGNGTLNREPFTADVRGAPLLNVDESKPYPFTLDVRAGATHIVADGTVTHPFDFGALQAHTVMSGNTLADLYYLTGLVMPSTPPYALTSTFSRDGQTYRLDDLTGRIGHSDLSGTLVVDASGERLFLTGDLHSHHVIFDDLGFLFGGGKGRNSAPKAPAPSQPAKSAKGMITVESGASPVSLYLPDTPLDVDRVRQMDARISYAADRIESQDLPLRRLSMRLSLDHGVLIFDPLSLTLVKGRIDGTVRVDASRDVPATALDLRLRDLSLDQFSPGQNPPPLEGMVEARAKLAGTGNSVHKTASSANGTFTLVVPHGQIRKAFAELVGIDLINGGLELLTGDKSSTNLRCMVASFDAHDGLLSARRVTFDTDVVSATGQGSVNLKNETLNLTLSGQPKKFRIGRLDAPIEITGSLQSPHVGVDASKALPQAGIGVALGVFAAPLAALLPFVNPGLADNADCGALVAQADARGVPVKKSVHHRAAIP
ncbi:MAG TPA: AsmA family protein [Rhizomicrobium sp.]|nr:AsmA family protein [Rhizomicrobium sp.]